MISTLKMKMWNIVKGAITNKIIKIVVVRSFQIFQNEIKRFGIKCKNETKSSPGWVKVGGWGTRVCLLTKVCKYKKNEA
jgi:hypothetical protein